MQKLGDDVPYSDNADGDSAPTEMRQTKKGGFVNPLVTRPSTYYGEGPFDPPSSDSDDEEGPAMQVNAEDDVESVSLLSGRLNTPFSPGRAERGDTSPRRSPGIVQVCLERHIIRILLISSNFLCSPTHDIEKLVCVMPTPSRNSVAPRSRHLKCP